MAKEELRVIFAATAWSDLEEIVEYWTKCGDEERGVQYAHDLPTAALRELSRLEAARTGKYLRHTNFPHVQELAVFKRSYRILYVLKETERVVQVLRFWHSHRDEPFS
jgi:plasmid stabilization system protein ParE